MIDSSQIDEYIEMWNDNLLGTDGLIDLVFALIEERRRLRQHIAYAASLIQCRIEGDDLSSSDIRDYLLHAVGMTIEEAMATTDLNLWGEEE